MSRSATVLIAMGLLVLARAGVCAQEVAHRYTETHGQKTATVEYRVSRTPDDVTASSSGGDTADAIRWRPGFGTYDWQMTDPAAGTAIHGERNGDVIHFTGTLKNRKVDRDVRLDPAPWYQVFGPLMDDLLPAGASQREFWVVDPGDLAPHKMQAKRVGTERLTLRGSTIDAVRIHFSPAGALSPFWGADFWFTPDDSTYLSSRLPEKGGTTVTTIEDLNQ